MIKSYHVVAGVIYQGNRILCVKKGKTKYDYTSYKYEFPGGKIESGETPEAALRRELREELQIQVEVRDYIMTVEYSYPDFSIRMEVYACILPESRPVLAEHVDLQWLPVDRLSQLDWCQADKIICHELTAG